MIYFEKLTTKQSCPEWWRGFKLAEQACESDSYPEMLRDLRACYDECSSVRAVINYLRILRGCYDYRELYLKREKQNRAG